MVIRTFVLSVLIPVFGLLPAAQAQFVQRGSKLVGVPTDQATCQGSSVAVSADGNTAIVGAFCGVGGVLVYVRANGGWIQQGPELVGSGAIAFSDQGLSVAISADGNTAIVGGPKDDFFARAAWVFTRTNGVWSQQGPKLVGSGGSNYAVQGASVAISADGNTALVGGPGDDEFGGARRIRRCEGGIGDKHPIVVEPVSAAIRTVPDYSLAEVQVAVIGAPQLAQ